MITGRGCYFSYWMTLIWLAAHYSAFGCTSRIAAVNMPLFYCFLFSWYCGDQLTSIEKHIWWDGWRLQLSAERRYFKSCCGLCNIADWLWCWWCQPPVSLEGANLAGFPNSWLGGPKRVPVSGLLHMLCLEGEDSPRQNSSVTSVTNLAPAKVGVGRRPRDAARAGLTGHQPSAVAPR